MSNAKEIWDKLSAIDVNKHTNKKNNFTYLSWTWAWATLQEHYPESSYEFRPDMTHADGSVEVWCDLTIEGITRPMWLAVTDFKNKPIPRPACDLVANARMRCLVKAIAMFGLGHYIYAGESLPMEVGEPKLDPVILDQFKACKTMDELKALWTSLANKDAYKSIKDGAKVRIESREQIKEDMK